MEQLNTGQLRGSNSAATFPLLLLILIDSTGFGMLTPLLAGALAPESDSPISHGFSEDRRYLIYGFATGLYPAMIFLAAPIPGAALRSHGPKDDSPGLRGEYYPRLRGN